MRDAEDRYDESRGIYTKLLPSDRGGRRQRWPETRDPVRPKMLLDALHETAKRKR